MHPRFPHILLILVLAAFTACGITTTTYGNGTASTTSPAATSTTTQGSTEPVLSNTPYSTSTAVTASTPAPGTLQPPPTVTGTTTPDVVTLTVNQNHVSLGTVIAASVHNGLATSISTMNHQSDCSVVQLQLQTSTGWSTVLPCKEMTPTQILPLNALGSMAVQLAGIQTAGTYRLVFQYFIGTDISPAAAIAMVTSGTFTVG